MMHMKSHISIQKNAHVTPNFAKLIFIKWLSEDVCKLMQSIDIFNRYIFFFAHDHV